MAAAVAIAIAVAWGAQFGERAVPQPHPTPQETLTLVAPLDTVSFPFDFQWASSLPNAAYRIELFDGRGVPVAARELRASRIAAHELLGADRARTAQSYTWKVTVLDDNGAAIVSSQPRPFQVR